METVYPQAGAEFTTTDEQRGAIEDGIAAIKWHANKKGLQLPLSQAMAFQEIAAEVNATAVQFGLHGTHDRGELLGVEFRYRDKIATSYWLDDGCAVVCLRVDVELRKQ